MRPRDARCRAGSQAASRHADAAPCAIAPPDRAGVRSAGREDVCERFDGERRRCPGHDLTLRPVFAGPSPFNISCSRYSSSQSGSTPEACVDGLIMPYQLTVPALLRRGLALAPGREIVTRRPDRTLHRYTFREFGAAGDTPGRGAARTGHPVRRPRRHAVLESFAASRSLLRRGTCRRRICTP